MNLAGIDIGTTGCKCTVYDDCGNFVHEAYEEYAIEVAENYHCIDPDVVWNGIQKVLKEIANSVKSIEAICIASFGEASIFMDKEGNPLGKAFLYTDPNGQIECDEIEKSIGKNYIYKTTGLSPCKMYSASKWKWQKKQNPELFKKASYICLFQDYIVYKLSGIRQIDYSLATRTMAFDVHKLIFDEKILKTVGVTKEMLSKPVPTGTMAGKMRQEMAEELGFENVPKIVTGCHDQIGAVIGSGIQRKNQAVDGTGTVECISCTYGKEENIKENRLNEGGYAIVPYGEDCYITYAFSYTGGALLKWYRDKLASLEAKECKEQGKKFFEEENKNIDSCNPSGLLILPYFAGAATPYMNNHAKGLIYGLTLDTTKEQIYQGLMEGVTYEMKLNLMRLEEAGVHMDEIFATGGGATSKEWLQIKADILGKRIISLGAAQSGTLACIMLAGVACKRFTNIEEASLVYVKYQDTYEPREEMQKRYEKLFLKYKELYPSLYGENR